MTDIKIKPKEATAVINSLLGGVVPKMGVQHITVGRLNEVATFVKALDEVKNGHGIMKFWVGDFGSGKSFMLHLLNTTALKQRFVVATTDFTPHTRLYSNDGKAQALYASLMNNIAIQTKPEGGALPVLLEKWIENILLKTAAAHQISPTEIRNPQYFNLIGQTIIQTLNEITDTGAFDFGLAVLKYYEGFIRQDDSLKNNALRWLKGEYATKTEARKDLGMSEIVNDRNYYEMLKNFCRLFVSIGYSGFVINLDEAVNLYKIQNPGMRQKNYEQLLRIYNDCFQGKIEHLYINIAATTDSLTDSEKGLYGYEALKTRLQVNKFETAALRDYAQPVVRLMPLNHDEIFVLLKKLKTIFDINYHSQVDFSYKDIRDFMEEMYNKPGASEFLTPREVIRDFLNILNIIRQNPTSDKKKLIAEIQIMDEREAHEAFAETEKSSDRIHHVSRRSEYTSKFPRNRGIAGQARNDECAVEYNNISTSQQMISQARNDGYVAANKSLANELKHWMNQIDNREIKTHLNRMSQIAGFIQEKDSLESEKFTMRHAETVTSLLKKYHAIASSGIKSAESQDSLRRISETLVLTKQAFEQELNNLFQPDILDTEAESKAYVQSLKNRGLIN
jgi:hypothetical protein